MKRIVFYISVLLFFISAQSYAQKIIVNKNNNIDSLSAQQIRNIFLGNSSVWENGIYIEVADYNSGSEIRNNFSQKFLQLTPRKVSMIWIKVSLSGKSIPPKIFDSGNDIVNFVSKNAGAIGYIASEHELPSNVKTINVE